MCRYRANPQANESARLDRVHARRKQRMERMRERANARARRVAFFHPAMFLGSLYCCLIVCATLAVYFYSITSNAN